MCSYDGALLLGHLMFVGGQEGPRLGGDPLTLRDTEFKEFNDGRGEVLEEQRFVGGIRLDVLLERLVLHERVIRRKHH